MPDEAAVSSPAPEANSQATLDSLSPEQHEKWLQTGEVESKPNEQSGGEKPESAETSDTSNNETRESVKRHKTGEDRKAELSQEIKALLDERANLRREIEQARSKPAPQADPRPATPVTQTLQKPVRPKLGDFEDVDAYEAATDEYFEKLSDYKTQQAIFNDRQQQAHRQMAENLRRQNAEISKSWTEREKGLKQSVPDFDAINALDAIKPSQTMDLFLQRAKNGPEVLHFLSQNMDAAMEINSMHPMDAHERLLEISRDLAGKKQAPTTKKITSAKPPPTTLSATRKGAEDEVESALERNDVSAYMDAMNKRDAARFMRR